MDRNKIREMIRKAHPNRRILSNEAAEDADFASSDDRDVDAGNLKLSTWNKFGPPRKPPTAADETPMAKNEGTSDAREKFRPRTLTGGTRAGETRTRTTPSPISNLASRFVTARYGAGKIAVERLELAPENVSADSAQDSLDVVVDEEHGIIGESDSGPEKANKG